MFAFGLNNNVQIYNKIVLQLFDSSVLCPEKNLSCYAVLASNFKAQIVKKLTKIYPLWKNGNI